jgi:hypothetical protein
MSTSVCIDYRIVELLIWNQKLPGRTPELGFLTIRTVPGSLWSYYTWTPLLSIVPEESPALRIVLAARMRKQKRPNPHFQAMLQITPTRSQCHHQERPVPSHSPTRALPPHRGPGSSNSCYHAQNYFSGMALVSICETCCSDDPYVTMVFLRFSRRKQRRHPALHRLNSIDYVPST